MRDIIKLQPRNLRLNFKVFVCAAKQPDKRPRQYIARFRRLFNSYSYFFCVLSAVFKT